MRKLMMIILVFLLMGCTEEAKSPVYKLEALKVEPVMTMAEETYYVQKTLMPTYADLLKYPHENLIDWDRTTDVTYRSGDQVTFVFDQQERVYAVDLEGSNLKRVRLGFGSLGVRDYLVVDHQVLLDQALTTDIMTLTLLDDCDLSEVHVRIETEVSQEEYEAFRISETFLRDLNQSKTWSADIWENLEVAITQTEEVGQEALLMHAQWIDFSVLRSELRGYPFIIRGQVVAIEAQKEYYKVIVDPIVLKQNLTIFMEVPVELDKIIDMHGIYIGYDDQHVFYGLE